MQDLVAADAVRAESFAAYVFKQPPLDVGLDGIVHLYPVFCRKFRHMVHCPAEQVHVIIPERGGNFVQLFY